ncbi:MAG: hypothetical protein P4L10_12545 [Acidobacteriaceae bacterium]|nr:hypothetical protein [Acidobacteriaceae bacterium]
MQDTVIPAPPRLHWVWVLVLSACTLGFFGNIWLIVQSYWSDKVHEGNSKALMFSVLNLSFFVIYQAAEFAMKHLGLSGMFLAIVALVCAFGAFIQVILYFTTVFVLRSELQKEPLGLSLGGVMTFLFGTLYFQYFLHDYSGSIRGGGPLGLSSYEPITINRVDETID